jgi:hypothetical protein
MKNHCILAAAAVFAGQLLTGSLHAVPLAGINMAPPSTPNLVLVQGTETLLVPPDRMARLRQHRSIIETALRQPPLAMPAEPLQPQPRALQAPEPMLSAVPQEPVSCEAAARIVADYGFSDVRPKDCSGGLYRFSATRDGTGYEIGITADAGEIADVFRQ